MTQDATDYRKRLLEPGKLMSCGSLFIYTILSLLISDHWSDDDDGYDDDADDDDKQSYCMYSNDSVDVWFSNCYLVMFQNT